MTHGLLLRLLRLGVLALLVAAPLPFGAVQPGSVFLLELGALALGLGALWIVSRDPERAASVPRAALAICLMLLGWGLIQLVPIPPSFAARWNPSAGLLRPLLPYLGLPHPPAVAWSVAPPETTDAILRVAAYVLIGLTAAVAFETGASRRRLGAVLVGSAVFQSVYGSGEYLSGRQHIFAFAKKYYLDSATGTFINRNHFATFLAMALPVALVLAISSPREGRGRRVRSWRERAVDASGSDILRVLAVVASALIWMGLLLSHSRGGLLAAIAGTAVVLVRYRGSRAARWTGALGVVVLGILLTLEMSQAPGERFLTVRDEIFGRTGRPAVWRDALGLVSARPLLGYGYGTFESAFPSVQSGEIDLRFDHAHNDWLEWATEGGLPLLAAAVALYALALRGTARSLSPGFSAAFAIASRGALIALGLHAMWDFSLRIPAVAVTCAVLMGIALARTEPARSASLGPSKVPDLAEASATGVQP